MRFFILVSALVLSGACLAQDKSSQPSPEIRAMSTRIYQEVNTSLQCQSYNYALEDRVKAAEAEVKRLTEKYEPNDSAK